MGTEGIWFKSSFFSTVKFFIQLKSIQSHFKLTQLIGGTFPRHFLKNLKQKSKQWHATRKRTSQNSGCHKKEFKIVWEKFQPRAGSICSKIDSTLIKISLVEVFFSMREKICKSSFQVKNVSIKCNFSYGNKKTKQQDVSKCQWNE